MTGLFGWKNPEEPLQCCARKYAKLVAKFRNRFPDRPLSQCLPKPMLPVAQALLPEGSIGRDELEELFQPKSQVDDPVEFCCRLASFEAGARPQDGRAWLELAEFVNAQLDENGLYAPSEWLSKLRASTGSEAPSAQKHATGELDFNEVMTVPRSPAAGNWIGLTLFGTIGAGCLAFGLWKGAIVLALIGLASFVTSVPYWVLDRARGRLILKRRSGLIATSHEYKSYPLAEIIAVSLDIFVDSEGGRNFYVSVVLKNGQSVRISDQRRDADRVATFLKVPKQEQTY